MPTLDRGTHALHYDVQGEPSAPPLLMIMGLGLSSQAWHDLPPRLTPSFRVITFDNAGTGRSSAPPSISMTTMAADAAAVIEAAGFERAAVFGISMGGMIAIELAIQHPERVERLVLGCTHGGYWKSKKPTFTTSALLAAGSVLQSHFPPRLFAKVLTTEQHFARDPSAFVAWLKAMDPAGPITTLRQMRAIMNHRADERLAQIQASTLVVTGDRDALVPAENSRRLAKRIPGAKLVEFSGAGHCFPVEQPAEVAGLIQGFLRPARAA